MIFYGTNSTKVQTEALDGVVCISCEQQPVYVITYARYAHVYWIPFFPIGKVTATECSHCKQVIEKKDFSYAYLEQVVRQKGNARTPGWHFAGLYIILALIGVGLVTSHFNKGDRIGMINKAQVGDRYHLKYSTSEYTIWKVALVTADSVYFKPHEYVTTKESGLGDKTFRGDMGYAEEVFALAPTQLVQMVEEGEITDVLR